MTYCSSRRAAVHIEPSSETKLDFILVPCATEEVGILTNGRLSGEEAREVSQFHFESLKVPAAKDTGELLLAFGTKREDQRFLDYEGAKISYLVRDQNSKDPKEEYKYMPVMLSYGLLAVYGDKVKITRETFEINVEGNVIVEDGPKRTQASAVRIRFAGDKPIVEFIR